MNVKTKLAATLAGTTIAIGAISACGDIPVKTEKVAQATTAIAKTTAPATTSYVPLTDEERFTGLLDQYGFYYSNTEAAVSMAESICKFRGQGYTRPVTIALLVEASSRAADSNENVHEYTKDDLTSLYEASTTVYCPQYS